MSKLRGALGVLGIGVAALTTTAPTAQAEPFIGDIMYVGFNFCPRGWAAADGTLLAISQNNALFALIGTIYGGDGRTTFALPDLRGRVPVNQGTGPGLSTYRIGARAGVENQTLTQANLPTHNHLINVTNEVGTKHGPGNDFLALANFQDGSKLLQYSDTTNRQMDPRAMSNTGGSQSFPVSAPRASLLACVALTGIFPPRS